MQYHLSKILKIYLGYEEKVYLILRHKHAQPLSNVLKSFD